VVQFCQFIVASVIAYTDQVKARLLDTLAVRTPGVSCGCRAIGSSASSQRLDKQPTTWGYKPDGVRAHVAVRRARRVADGAAPVYAAGNVVHHPAQRPFRVQAEAGGIAPHALCPRAQCRGVG
jgi:hypothetical protein